MSKDLSSTERGTNGAYVTGGAEFTRDTSYFENRITRRGATGKSGKQGVAACVVYPS